jgi:type II secretory ATPase GspE/PulE/Tfp pilus assembly ATPase PilB-like protein
MTETEFAEGPVYDSFEDSDRDKPQTRLLMVVLLDAVKQGCERIHLDPNSGDEDKFVVYYEKNGELIEKGAAPILVWPSVVLKLRSIAGLGRPDAASLNGNFSLRLSKNRVANFRVLADPQSHPEKKFTIAQEIREAPPEPPRKTLEELESEFRKLRQAKNLEPPD